MGDIVETYIVWLLNQDSMHQSSCEFPGADCTCKRVKKLDHDESLIRGGYIDSFMIEELLVYFQVEFAVEIHANEVNEDNFDTINKMVELIYKYK